MAGAFLDRAGVSGRQVRETEYRQPLPLGLGQRGSSMPPTPGGLSMLTHQRTFQGRKGP